MVFTDSKDIISIIGIVASIIVAMVSLFFTTKPEEGVIVLFGLLGTIFLFFLVSYPLSIWKKRMAQIEANTNNIRKNMKDIISIKNRFSLNEKISDINSRVSLIERLMKNVKKRSN